MNSSKDSSSQKIKSLRSLLGVLSKERKSRRKIIFTNGCFDILHVGHVRYLRAAKRLGDRLVLGLNTDDSVKKLKGPGRPVNSERDRAEVLAALEAVDYVVLFSDPTPLRLIRAVRPDFLVKGGDWKKKDLVGSDFVESDGGEVKLPSVAEGVSATRTLKKIKKSG